MGNAERQQIMVSEDVGISAEILSNVWEEDNRPVVT